MIYQIKYENFELGEASKLKYETIWEKFKLTD